MALTCPICAKPLLEARSGKIRLDGCARCGGVWLTREAVGTVRHLTHPAVTELDAQLGWCAEPATRDVAGRPCPACGKPMEQRPDSLHPTLRIDTCAACAGVWLDPGELGTFRISGADRAAASGTARPTTEDRLIGVAWCLEVVGTLLDIFTDN